MRVSKERHIAYNDIKKHEHVAERDMAFLFEDQNSNPVMIVSVGGVLTPIALNTGRVSTAYPLVRQLQGYSVTLTNE